MKNNSILIGKVNTLSVLDHTVNGENFYLFYLLVKRMSGVDDIIPLIVSEHILGIHEIKINSTIKIVGEIHSYYNKHSTPKLRISLFVREIYNHDNSNDFENNNIVLIEGSLEGNPTYKITAGGRQITNLLIATERRHNKIDYIPCIVWGRIANFAMTLKAKTKIRIIGRIQSRKYTKKANDTIKDIDVCEISVKTLNII